ncbi:MAG: carboxyl transferase domain-containing protein [Pseudomonadota bacterium]|nr:carboxyl transferase domain-containing protein [Pseudomonadota bacterium]
MSWEKDIKEIKKREKLALNQGGEDSIKIQHSKGRKTLRERLDYILDNDSFDEIGKISGSSTYNDDGELENFTPANFLLGFGRINNRKVIIGGEDFTLKGGSPNPAGLRKSIYTEELALQYKIPLIRLHEGGGGSVTGSGGSAKKPTIPNSEPVFSRNRFQTLAQCLGVIPVATAALGPVAGLPAARLVASHFSVMTENSQVLIAGPAVVKRALGIDISKEDLGGPEVHLRSGVVDNLAENEEDALYQIQNFLSYLPNNFMDLPPSITPKDKIERKEGELLSIIPKSRRKAYDMRKLLNLILDNNTFFEMSALYGSSLITGLARLNGRSVAIIANDCMFYAGAMTSEASQKLRRFIDFVNTFNIPVLSFVDEPGFMIGPDSEKAGTIRHGTAAISSVMQSIVPWASIIVRKVYGVAGAAHFAPDGYVLSWPSAESGALPVEGGVAIAFKKEIENADNPEQKRKELEELLAKRSSPFPRSENFSVHELIDPRETRPKLISWIELAISSQVKPTETYKTTMLP